MALIDDLQTQKSSLSEFKVLTKRVLNYSSDVVSNKINYNGFTLSSSMVAGTEKKIRPVNNNLYLFKEEEFIKKYNEFVALLKKLKNGERDFPKKSYEIVDCIVYTMQQTIGIGFDLLGESNSARKHVGNRFEELIRLIISEIGIKNKKLVLNIPYKAGTTNKNYRCEIDIVISPHSAVKSTNKVIDPSEVIIFLKTTTKDRMGKIFIDKLLVEKFTENQVKVVGISLNDVQRKSDSANNSEKISYTFVSNLFIVYTNFLTKLDGYYYVDTPKSAKSAPFNNHIFSFSKFVIEDVWNLLI